MTDYRKHSLIAGILFLCQLIPYFIAHDTILGEILYASDLVASVTSNRAQVAFASLLELFSAFCFIGFSVILYNYLKRDYSILSLTYVAVRFVEFGLIVYSQIKLMTLAAMSSQVLSPQGGEMLPMIARSLFQEWKWINFIYMVIFCVNALIFYYLLLRTKIIPSFIAVWGLIGATVAITGPVAIMFGESMGGMIVYALIGLNELFLALWLTFKGFSKRFHTAGV